MLEIKLFYKNLKNMEIRMHFQISLSNKIDKKIWKKLKDKNIMSITKLKLIDHY